MLSADSLQSRILLTSYFAPWPNGGFDEDCVAQQLRDVDEDIVLDALKVLIDQGMVEPWVKSFSGKMNFRSTRLGWEARERLLRSRGMRMPCVVNQMDYRPVDLILALLMSHDDALRIHKPSGPYLFDNFPAMTSEQIAFYLDRHSLEQLDVALRDLVTLGRLKQLDQRNGNFLVQAFQATLKGERFYYVAVKASLGLRDEEHFLMEKTKKQISLFHAWQSDYDESRRIIASALDDLINKLNGSNLLAAPIFLETATKVGEGAIHIDSVLLDKIQNADLFVADLSPVYQYGGRLCPNPNVLIETGYALAMLRPDQIVLLEQIRPSKDVPGDRTGVKLPFDIDHVKRIRFNEYEDLMKIMVPETIETLRQVGLVFDDVEGPDAKN